MTPRLAEDRLLSVHSAAERLGVCSKTIRRWIHAGKLQATRYPSGYFGIPLSSVAQIMRGQLRTTADITHLSP